MSDQPRGLILTSSTMYAIFHLFHSILCLGLAICGNRLPGSLAKVGNVYGETSNGLSNPLKAHRLSGKTYKGTTIVEGLQYHE